MAFSTDTSERSKKTLCGSSELAWEACEEDSGEACWSSGPVCAAEMMIFGCPHLQCFCVSTTLLPSLLSCLLLLLSPAFVHAISALSLVERGEKWGKWRWGQLLLYFSSKITCQLFPPKVSHGHADPQTTCHINLSMKPPNRLMGKTFLPSEKWKSFTFFFVILRILVNLWHARRIILLVFPLRWREPRTQALCLHLAEKLQHYSCEEPTSGMMSAAGKPDGEEEEK